jgi:hypothetical protein
VKVLGADSVEKLTSGQVFGIENRHDLEQLVKRNWIGWCLDRGWVSRRTP